MALHSPTAQTATSVAAAGSGDARRGDPLGALRGRFPHDPTFLCFVYVLGSLGFVIALMFAGARPDSMTLHVATYAHIAMPVLLLGLAIFPNRLVWLPSVTFAVCFLTVELYYIWASSSSDWSPLLMMSGLLTATMSGVIGGIVVQRTLLAHDRGSRFATPERAALFGGLATALICFVIGGLALWQDVYGNGDSVDLWTVLLLYFQRAGQLSLYGTAAILAFLNPPDRKAVPEILLHVLLFGVMGAIHKLGWAEITPLDAPILSLFLLITRPIQTAVAGSLIGLCVFILLTGFYADLPVSLTSLATEAMPSQDAKMMLMSNTLFLALTALSLSRIHQSRMDRIRQQTLGRMTRAQELARFGYFLYDSAMHVVWLDPLAQRILSVGPSASEDEFLQRINPEDRDAVSQGAVQPQEGGRSFSFRFSLDGMWRPDCPQHHFTGFARYERGSGGQMLTYGIVVDVTQEHVQEEHLRMVLAELSERQGQQTQLFSMISHELRTPAAIISMLADELDEGKSWKEKGPQVRATLDQLLSILSDMRQTVRPEQNLPVHIEIFRPMDLAVAVRDTFRSMAQARGIDIHLQMGQGANELRTTDRVRLNQTLANLVKNAILHSQATQITVAYVEETGHLGVWTVSDNGRNIPQTQRERLFHPFARSVDAEARVDGSGLGLYIAKGAIELLGGTIEYLERPMSGAVFRVSLPMKLPQDQISVTPVEPERTIDLSGLRALVVEDSETMGTLLVARLSKVFAEVKWLRDGASGLAWTSLNAPDVIISDLFMPGLSGDELARKLRQNGFDRPIIGMTATDIGEEVERFRKSGADAVITKPLRPHDIQLALARLLP